MPRRWRHHLKTEAAVTAGKQMAVVGAGREAEPRALSTYTHTEQYEGSNEEASLLFFWLVPVPMPSLLQPALMEFGAGGSAVAEDGTIISNRKNPQRIALAQQLFRMPFRPVVITRNRSITSITIDLAKVSNTKNFTNTRTNFQKLSLGPASIRLSSKHFPTEEIEAVGTDW